MKKKTVLTSFVVFAVTVGLILFTSTKMARDMGMPRFTTRPFMILLVLLPAAWLSVTLFNVAVLAMRNLKKPEEKRRNQGRHKS